MLNKHMRDKFVGLVNGLEASSPDGGSWLDNAVVAIDKMADNDKKVARFRDELRDRVGYNTNEYRTGIEKFIHEMSIDGDFGIASDNAFNAAGIPTRSAPAKKPSSDGNWLSKLGHILKNNFGK